MNPCPQNNAPCGPTQKVGSQSCPGSRRRTCQKWRSVDGRPGCSQACSDLHLAPHDSIIIRSKYSMHRCGGYPPLPAPGRARGARGQLLCSVPRGWVRGGARPARHDAAEKSIKASTNGACTGRGTSTARCGGRSSPHCARFFLAFSTSGSSAPRSASAWRRDNHNPTTQPITRPHARRELRCASRRCGAARALRKLTMNGT